MKEIVGLPARTDLVYLYAWMWGALGLDVGCGGGAAGGSSRGKYRSSGKGGSED